MTQPATDSSRMPLIDAMRALCCLLIVAHHLALYGPMPDMAYPLMPAFMDWLREHARIAVQMFFEIAGYLAAAKLAPRGISRVSTPLRLIRRRYLRLILPYLAALTVAIVGAAVARMWLQHESIPASPHFLQLLAHILLLHDLLNQGALSAGVWYVAIDFQLYVLTILLFWGTNSILTNPTLVRHVNGLLVLVLTAVSLFFFNRDSYWDETALYFFGAYGLGMLIYWASSNRYRLLCTIALMALITLALLIDFRLRVVVAGCVMMILAVAQYFDVLNSNRIPGIMTAIGRASYSIFLIHFPVALIFNAVFFRFLPHQPAVQGMGLILAAATSISAGMLLSAWLETRTVGKPAVIALIVGFISAGLVVPQLIS